MDQEQQEAVARELYERARRRMPGWIARVEWPEGLEAPAGEFWRTLVDVLDEIERARPPIFCLKSFSAGYDAGRKVRVLTEAEALDLAYAWFDSHTGGKVFSDESLAALLIDVSRGVARSDSQTDPVWQAVLNAPVCNLDLSPDETEAIRSYTPKPQGQDSSQGNRVVQERPAISLSALSAQDWDDLRTLFVQLLDVDHAARHLSEEAGQASDRGYRVTALDFERLQTALDALDPSEGHDEQTHQRARSLFDRVRGLSDADRAVASSAAIALSKATLAAGSQSLTVGPPLTEGLSREMWERMGEVAGWMTAPLTEAEVRAWAESHLSKQQDTCDTIDDEIRLLERTIRAANRGEIPSEVRLKSLEDRVVALGAEIEETARRWREWGVSVGAVESQVSGTPVADLARAHLRPDATLPPCSALAAAKRLDLAEHEAQHGGLHAPSGTEPDEATALAYGTEERRPACSVCDGQQVVDDRGFALRGQPFFDTKPCPKCAKDGAS